MTEETGNVVEQITQYINPGMIGAVLALWVIGYVLKRTPAVPNWAILWAMIALGIAAGLVIVGLTADGVIQGVLAAALAVLGYQGYKQTRKAVDAAKSNTDA